ncbi:MAG TPA: MATE family efflux transporter [Candidatus Bathyarchaeia archaeon]|nr:MATE family efflux transporter [Candidatus Bathyarchaeia archaeon]
MDKAVYRQVMTLALPVIISNILMTFQIIADTIMLGRYPPADVSLSAVGLGFVLYHMFFPLTMGLVTGTIAIIARRWGEKNYDEAGKVATDSMITLVLISIPIAIFGVFIAPHLTYYLGARGMVITEGAKYIRSIFAFYPFTALVIVYHGILRAAGDTKTPMYVDIISNVYNVLMNYILIFGKFGFPELGVLGAGIATGSSYAIAFAVYMLLQAGNKLITHPVYSRNVRYRLDTVKKMFKIGIPAGIDMAMWSFASIIFTVMILHFGTVGYSAFQIGLRAESIAYMPAFAFGIAATTLSGQYLGAKKEEQAKKAVLASTYLCLIFMAVVGAIFILVPDYIAMVFTGDEGVVTLAALYLFIIGFSEPALGAFFALTGGMRGAGYTKVPMLINFICLIVIRLSLSYTLGFVLGMGLFGIWLGMTVEVFLRTTVIYAVFLKGNWMRVKV